MKQKWLAEWTDEVNRHCNNNIHLYSAFLLVVQSALQSVNTWKTNNIQIQHNRILKPQLAEGNQLAIYKRGQGFELGTTNNKSSKWPEQDSNPGLPYCESNTLTTRPRCLPVFIHINDSIHAKDTNCIYSFCCRFKLYSTKTFGFMI